MKRYEEILDAVMLYTNDRSTQIYDFIKLVFFISNYVTHINLNKQGYNNRKPTKLEEQRRQRLDYSHILCQLS